MKRVNKKFYVGLLFSCLSLSLWASEKTLIATERGIVGDGITLNTVRIQRAIDELGQKGGGCLTFPAGTYLTGNIQMRDNIEICLEKGAVLLGSTNPKDYQPLSIAGDGDVKRKDSSRMALILGHNVRNVKLTGYGTIDGQGRELALHVDSLCLIRELVDPSQQKWFEELDNNPNMKRATRRPRPSELLRPKLLFFSDCKDITVEHLYLRNSACWGLSFNACENLTFNDLHVHNRAYWNNDGIDLTDCKHARITHCEIDSADDGICLKSDLPDRCNDDIYISDCNIVSSASAVKFGTASYGGFKNVVIKDIRIRDTFRSAIAIESVDGGEIENILVDHIFARNTGNAIFVRLGQRAGDRKGYLRNVTIRNVSCEIPFGRPDEAYDVRGPISDTYHNQYPSSITGIPDNAVENVLLENIEIICPGRASRAMGYVPLTQLRLVPEQVNAYPEYSMFGELPAWAFYVRHVNGISFRNIRLSLVEDDFRPAFVFDEVKKIEMDNIVFPLWKKEGQVFIKE